MPASDSKPVVLELTEEQAFAVSQALEHYTDNLRRFIQACESGIQPKSTTVGARENLKHAEEVREELKRRERT